MFAAGGDGGGCCYGSCYCRGCSILLLLLLSFIGHALVVVFVAFTLHFYFFLESIQDINTYSALYPGEVQNQRSQALETGEMADKKKTENEKPSRKEKITDRTREKVEPKRTEEKKAKIKQKTNIRNKR